jgi:dihydrofolate synthase/folylpolyglutamate synthase
VVTGWLPSAAISRISVTASRENAPLHELNMEIAQCPQTNLQGSFQRRNAALASHAVNILNPLLPIENKTSQKGLLQVNLPGRWQVIPGKPTIVLDACHNQGGVISLLENLQTLEKPFILWVAAFGSDRAKEVIEAVSPLADRLVFFTSPQPRACSFGDMLAVTPLLFHSKVTHGNWEDLDKEFDDIRAHPEKKLVVTGSIYLVGHVLSFLQNMADGNNSELQDIL